MKKTALFILLVLSGLVQAQNESDVHKIGIKTSINLSQLRGSELQNPSIKFGYTAGAYYQFTINENLFLHSEFLGNFQGSNFDNADDEYSRISLFYLDFPVLLGFNLDEDKKHQVYLGPYGSYLGLSSMFIGGKRKAEQNDLDLLPFDYGGALYYQLNGKFMAFQIGVKAGMLDINNGINFANINPPTGNNGSIQNISLELGMLF